MKIAARFLASFILTGLLSAPALAQSVAAARPTPHPNEDCLACHGDESAPKPVLPTVFGASIHGQAGVACVDCHTDVATAEIPHAEKLAPVNCATCHGDAVAKYDGSVHAEARRAAPGTSPAAACKDCHGTHEIRPSSDPESLTHHLNLPRTCGRCHGNPDIIKRGGIAIGNVMQQFQDSIHGRALTRGGLVVAPNCSDCHGAHDIERSASPESRVFRTNVPATCGKCHEGVQRRYMVGVHGTAMQGGNTFAPVCSTCHSAHEIQRAETDSWQLQVVRECGRCHTESIRTYRDTFHGQVTALGFLRVATCADCHGAHDVFPKEDPRSSVSKARLVNTCGRCHEGATPAFVQYDPHADKHNKERNPALYYAARFMESLLVFVFAFFGIHTTLWFTRSLAARRGSGAPPRGPSPDRQGAAETKVTESAKEQDKEPNPETDTAQDAEKSDE